MFTVLRSRWAKSSQDYQPKASFWNGQRHADNERDPLNADATNDEMYDSDDPYAIRPNWKETVRTQDMVEGSTSNDPSSSFFFLNNRGFRGDAARDLVEDMNSVSQRSEREVKSFALEHY